MTTLEIVASVAVVWVVVAVGVGFLVGGILRVNTTQDERVRDELEALSKRRDYLR